MKKVKITTYIDVDISEKIEELLEDLSDNPDSLFDNFLIEYKDLLIKNPIILKTHKNFDKLDNGSEKSENIFDDVFRLEEEFIKTNGKKFILSILNYLSD